MTITDSDYVGIGDTWVPLGNGVTCYAGEFNGNGFEIKGLKVSSATDYTGLFGCLDSAFVHNLGLTNADIDGVNYVGALAGAVRNWTTVSQVFTTGTITGGSQTGGLVGTNEGGVDGGSYISDCYSRANITMLDGAANVGGLVGYNKDASDITNTYSTGSGAIGGLVGTNDTGGTINNSFWDTTTSGISGAGNGTGAVTSVMKTKTTFTDVAWDFDTTWAIDELDGIKNDGYPYFQWQIFDNVLIHNWTDLETILDNPPSNYILTKDLKTTDSDYIGIGDTWVSSSKCFTGSLDGGGFTIDGLTINNASDYTGLFGCLNSAIINDIGLTNVNITGGFAVGTIAGLSDLDSQISESYATGSVTGLDKTGGLVGFNKNDSGITNSYSRVNITIAGEMFDNSIGGLVGVNSTDDVLGGNISKSYSTGSGALGGLLGINSVGSVTNSFWDTETSAQPVSDGGTGKLTSEMKTQSTFTGEGWDFVNIWSIDLTGVRNDGYPYLGWQSFVSGSLPVAPSSALISIDTTDSFTVGWTDNSSDETGFKVYTAAGAADCSTATYSGTPDFTTAADVVTQAITGKSVNTQYCAKVVATNATGDSTAAYAAPKYTLANVPTAPTLGSPTSSLIPVTINQNSNPVNTTYTVKVVDGVNTNYLAIDGTLSATAIWDTYVNFGGASGISNTGLVAGTNYTYSVAARNGDTTATAYGTTSSAITLSNYTITASTDATGTISPLGLTTVTSGDTQIVTFSANSGYHISTLLVDSVAQVTLTTPYTFTNVVANHTISITTIADDILSEDLSDSIIITTKKRKVPPVFVKLSDTDNRLINIDENEIITVNPFLIKVKPIDHDAISKVEFYVDDILIGTDWQPDINGLYDCIWDTSKYHSIVRVVAYNIYNLSAELVNINTTVNLTGITTLPQTGKN